ncbi:DUF3618 domain-containing protein [Croceibacterium aestuarii]|uniref:DUF3618 domain-containing protein n=1 Tax=Croceibacterium aestuarii TaxID=3064139 RepID=UPI00272DDB69|nr:DUF3618 domain-containing protein [Croceibacterium sp. D39]
MTYDDTTIRTDTRDPEEIESEIRRTQRDMSRTADRIGAQMTPRNIFDALLDKADENGIDARYVLDAARRNPIALGMIAAGGLWLVSDSDARAKTFTDKFGGEPAPGDEWDHAHHLGYVEHMSSVEPREGENTDAYRRRRDCARASYLMIEQRHDEDESSFRKRLDDATDQMREQRDRVAEKARDMGRRTSDQASRLAGKAERAYRENPLIGGLVAAIAGAMAGAAFPATRTEEEYLGEYGADTLDAARDKAREGADKMREKKDEAVDKADRELRDAGRSDGADRARSRSYETA